MGPAIVIFDRDPQGRTMLWYVMTAFFIALVLHRAGTSYRMDERSLTIRRWWGLLGDVVIPYGEISQVEVKRSLAATVSGRGHVLVATGGGAWEPILSQKDPEALQRELERLSGEAAVRGPGFGGDAYGGGDADSGEGPDDEGPRLDADNAAETDTGNGGPVETGPSLDADAEVDGGAQDDDAPPETPSLGKRQTEDGA
jgi:hypothetical protein